MKQNRNLVQQHPRQLRRFRVRTVFRTLMLGVASWVLPVCGWLR